MPKCPVALEGDKEMVEWENWARNQLMAAGSDLLGKFSNLQVTTKNHYPKSVQVVYRYCYVVWCQLLLLLLYWKLKLVLLVVM